ncbi:uncharacterized protein TNIN_177951 [Trichonephila inaurata madagascariensis]|uniref:Apple domain-containing protein n=1 Tax=Trichonephila inaurata madagascariensis TaxID=2747483 RepID=A0A8X7BY07_9ARAC|nr:uncharacterized protein TNIN_177951 [Trichonephila inaurata madagascariensis]
MAICVSIVVIISLIGPPAINSLEVTEIVYNFLFEDKLHEKWILYTADDSHMISCLQNCRNNSDCSGIAIGNFTEDSQNYSRTCHTLSGIDTADCEDGSCDTEAKGRKIELILSAGVRTKIIYIENQNRRCISGCIHTYYGIIFAWSTVR